MGISRRSFLPNTIFYSKKLIPLLIALCIAFLLLTWLYLKSEQIDYSAHVDYVHHLRTIKAADARVEAEVLAAQLTQSNNFDALDSYSKELLASAQNTSNLPLFIPLVHQQKLHIQVELVQTMLKQKLQLIEHFKHNNVIWKNSKENVQNLLNEISHDSSLSNIKTPLEYYSQHILLSEHKLRKTNLQEGNKIVSQIANAKLTWLEWKLVEEFTIQGQTLLAHQPMVNDLIKDIRKLNIALAHEKLFQLYVTGFNTARGTAKLYRNLLYFVVLVLTAYLTLTFIKLDRMRSSLAKAHQENLEHLQAHKKAEKLLRLHDTAFNSTNEAITITDAKGKVIEVNPAFTRITGYERSEVLGKNPRVLKSGRHDEEFYQAMWKSIVKTGNWRGEIWNRNKYGVIYPEILSVTSVKNEKNEVTNYVAVFSDIGQIKEQEQKLQKMAYYDSLTNLPNRVLLMDRINQSKLQAQRKQNIVAICFMDLDGFKPVNDTFGHEAGDKVLVELSNRLVKELRGGDTISRLGGDEFVFLFLGLEHKEECYHLIQRVMKLVSMPFIFDDEQVTLSASIGITFYPDDDMNAEALLRHADHAMYQAKQKGKNGYCVFNPEQDLQEREHNEQIINIETALRNDEFIVYYQPKVELRTDRVIGLEALIRWQLPDGSIKMPGDFLPAIEGHDLIIDIGNWVMESVLKDMSIWQSQGLDLKVSVNVTSYELHQPEFVKVLKEHFSKYPNVSPAKVELEVLETTALEDIVLMSEIMEECKKIGVGFALDDFGTGYSSLTYLKRLPANALKIDMSFVRDMLVDPENLAIVHGIVGLANAFQREVVVEGVETLEHGEMLIKMGCSYAQGFAIAKPMPANKILNWLSHWEIPPIWKEISGLTWDDADYPLFAAEVEHQRWISVIVYAVNQEKPIPHRYIHDDEHCQFGHWYYGIGKKYFRTTPSLMKKIGDMHQLVHSQAEGIDRMIQERNIKEAKKKLHGLLNTRDQLIEYLHQLAIEIGNPHKRN